ncbi:MAG: hypothetical protein Q9221_003551 [Calogaya cf. arnoldii]
MYPSCLAHISFTFLLFLTTTAQTNIEYWDSDTIDPLEAHILQKCRFLSGGECCVPVDLAFPQTRRFERFLPYKIVFEYISTDRLYVFANQPACRGPPVGFYQRDPNPRRPAEYVKDFVRRPDWRWTGALFFPVLSDADEKMNNRTVLTKEDEANTAGTEEGRAIEAREQSTPNVVHPWSISYRGLMHYETPRGSLDYIDLNGRSRIRGIPQFGKSFLEGLSVLGCLMWLWLMIPL